MLLLLSGGKIFKNWTKCIRHKDGKRLNKHLEDFSHRHFEYFSKNFFVTFWYKFFPLDSIKTKTWINICAYRTRKNFPSIYKRKNNFELFMIQLVHSDTHKNTQKQKKTWQTSQINLNMTEGKERVSHSWQEKNLLYFFLFLLLITSK